MTTFVIKKDRNGNISKIEVSGHSLFADYGNDIVCASISTAVLVTINAIEKIGLITNIKYQILEANVTIEQQKFDFYVNALLENLEYTILNLKKQYNNNINYKKKEE